MQTVVSRNWMTLPTSHRAEALDPFAGRRLRLTAADHYNLTSDSQHESFITALDSVYTAKRAIADSSAISKQRASVRSSTDNETPSWLRSTPTSSSRSRVRSASSRYEQQTLYPCQIKRFDADCLTPCSSTDPRR